MNYTSMAEVVTGYTYQKEFDVTSLLQKKSVNAFIAQYATYAELVDNCNNFKTYNYSKYVHNIIIVY